jgi:hypothetical protein
LPKGFPREKVVPRSRATRPSCARRRALSCAPILAPLGMSVVIKQFDDQYGEWQKPGAR